MKTLSVTAAAELLQMSPDALMRKARAGIVPGTKVGKRWVFSEDDLRGMLRRLVSERAARFAPVYARANHMTGSRRALQLERTPCWADLADIYKFYYQCEELTRSTGIQHHVDHIVPLLGRRVSGLHVAENLRVIPAIDNLRKGNHHDC